MTVETLKQLKIPITPANDTACIYAESAIAWINANTSLEYDLDNMPESLPSAERLFILKFYELMSVSPGIASESISGLSQSYTDSSRSGLLLWQYAQELLGEYMCGSMRAVPAEELWQ